MGKIRSISSCVVMKSLIFSIYSSLISSDLIRGRWEKLSVVVCFVSGIYRISKSNKRIYASHLVIKILGRSAPDRFNWIVRTFISISKIKYILYSYIRTFFKAIKILWYSRFVVSYFYLTRFYSPFL